LIKGWQRVFNLYHSQFDGAVLNVRKNDSHVINVEVIEIDGYDLAQFFIRESSYDFEKIPLDEIEFIYNGKANFTATHAYMCVSRYDVRKQPLEHYLKTCMYSCKQISEGAMHTFMDGTVVYHLEQEMTVREYLQLLYGDKGVELFSTNDGGY
jgi:hypothetical protein